MPWADKPEERRHIMANIPSMKGWRVITPASPDADTGQPHVRRRRKLPRLPGGPPIPYRRTKWV